jgi:SpoVK/Ycf46/Vps4 family AAA+-type ATPase
LFQSGGLRPPKGVLLHGPSGTGKSSLALQVAHNLQQQSSQNSNGVHVEHVQCTSLQSQTALVGQAERRLVQVFQSAKRPRPGKSASLVILDDVHLICPRRQGTNLGADRLSATLLALLDGLDSSSSESSSSESSTPYPMVILAVTTNPSLLDPALRRPGRLDSEVEVPLPDEPSTRSQILQFQLESLGAKASLSQTEWLTLARLAKGFTGADLKLAVKEALRATMEGTIIIVNKENLEKAIRSTKPSAIKAVTVEIPQVHWSSIGGMDSVKHQLREAIELPLTHGHMFQKLGIRPPRGVLLYGPPGCSKTLMARALATEGHMNFLAVKGPELLSKWLGESERALASLFRRARLASPSVIFFDEVDAIASKRGGSNSGGERLLSQLLTELDGIQSKNDAAKKQRVVVVCATNRPDLLDSALMRPGRIDRMIYVGVPDEESRFGILQISLQGKAIADDIDVSVTYCM